MISMRKAKRDDVYFLAKVCRSADRLYKDIMPGVFGRQALKFENDGLPSTYDVWIIMLEDKHIGFLGIKQLDESIVYLPALYLLEEFQRLGYGKMIVDNLISFLEGKGAKEIALLAHKDAFWAITFYEKNGFEIISHEQEDIKAYRNGALSDYLLKDTVLIKRILKKD